MILITIPNAIIRMKDERTGIRAIIRIPADPASCKLPPIYVVDRV